MLDLFYKENNIVIQNSDKKWIIFDTLTNEVLIDDYNVTHPWEYEKSAILLEVKKYNWELYYNFLIEWIHLVIISNDKFELKEEILEFFWDVDLLIIIWSKESATLFENIEAKIVVPYGEAKDIFLNTLWQNIEATDKFKQKWELPIDSTEFINLEK